MGAERGFSLLEVLVSLALISLVGLAGYSLVDSLARVHDRLDSRFAHLESLHVVLADFADDVSSADPQSVQAGAGGLILGTQACLGTIQYTAQSGMLVREVAGCPQARFELPGIKEVSFAVIDADMNAWTQWPAPPGPGLVARAVRIDLSGAEEAAGLSLYKIVDLPDGRAQ